ncbi:MAG: hypothetical protein ACK46E_00380, partial [Pseudanabaena sp.]
ANNFDNFFVNYSAKHVVIFLVVSKLANRIDILNLLHKLSHLEFTSLVKYRFISPPLAGK